MCHNLCVADSSKVLLRLLFYTSPCSTSCADFLLRLPCQTSPGCCFPASAAGNRDKCRWSLVSAYNLPVLCCHCCLLAEAAIPHEPLPLLPSFHCRPPNRPPTALCQGVIPHKPLLVRRCQRGAPATAMPLLLHPLLAAQLCICIQRCPCQPCLDCCLRDNTDMFQPRSHQSQSCCCHAKQR